MKPFRNEGFLLQIIIFSSMPKKKTPEEFIADSRIVHGDKYDYSRVVYKNNRSKVEIICKEHGSFYKAPGKHLSGQGCRVCKGCVELTQKSFEERSNKQHGEIYDYSKSIVKKRNDKVIILCKKHGEFKQTPAAHLTGQGCPKCRYISSGNSNRHSLKEYIQDVKKIHGDKYDYSKFVYSNSKAKGEIICPIHGMFLMTPNHHTQGSGCPKCGRIKANKSSTLDYSIFLERASNVHGSIYMYDESSYKKYSVKMNIMCSKHGWFEQTPHSHISMKAGCSKCGSINRAESNKKLWESVLDSFREIHGNRYDYDESSYADVSTKMKIKCPTHGFFLQTPSGHYQGYGCEKCGRIESGLAIRVTLEDFKFRSEQMHGDKYDYSNCEFDGVNDEVEIICPKHGSFYQTARDHFRGAGCQKCNSSRGETKVRLILTNQNIGFSEQKTFSDLIHKQKLRCDFYLPEYNTVIEYNGLQHYKSIEYFGGEQALADNQKRDIIKYRYLEEKGINLVVVRYDEEDVESYLLNRLSTIESI